MNHEKGVSDHGVFKVRFLYLVGDQLQQRVVEHVFIISTAVLNEKEKNLREQTTEISELIEDNIKLNKEILLNILFSTGLVI